MKVQKGVTLVEVLIAGSVLSMVCIILFSFYRGSISSYRLTNWKQESNDLLKKNNAFWDKYFAAATDRVEFLRTDSRGVIIGKAKITSVPVKMRNSGRGNLLRGYKGGASPWKLWEFESHIKNKAGNNFETYIISAYLTGRKPNIELFGEVRRSGKVINKVKLLSGVDSILASLRSYDEENVTSIKLEFILKNPSKSSMELRSNFEMRVNTKVISL